MTSPYLQRGRKRATLARGREEAMSYLSRQQFFDSDCVKAFHRQLIMADNMKEREEQIRENQRLAAAAIEDNRRLLEQVRLTESELLERENLAAMQRRMKTRSVDNFVRQQIREREEMKRQIRLDAEREAEEWQQLQKQYQRDKEMERQKERERNTRIRSAYMGQILERSAMKARESKQEEMDEMCTRQMVQEKASWTKPVNDTKAERQDRLEWRKEKVAQLTASKMQEETRRKEQEGSRALARALAQQEAERVQRQNERYKYRKAMMDGMATQREFNRIQQEQAEREQRRRERQAIQATREINNLSMENDRQMAHRKREELRAMTYFNQQQIAAKQAREKFEREAQWEFEAKNLEQLFDEDVQFHAYTAAVLRAFSEAGGNVKHLRSAARKGMENVDGCTFGGQRADYHILHATDSRTADYITGST